MTSDGPKLPEQVLQTPVDAGAALPSDDPFTAGLRGFWPLGILAILMIALTGNIVVGKMVVLPVGAVLVLVWTWRSRTPWREIGYARPRSWMGTLAVGSTSGCTKHGDLYPCFQSRGRR